MTPMSWLGTAVCISGVLSYNHARRREAELKAAAQQGAAGGAAGGAARAPNGADSKV